MQSRPNNETWSKPCTCKYSIPDFEVFPQSDEIIQVKGWTTLDSDFNFEKNLRFGFFCSFLLFREKRQFLSFQRKWSFAVKWGNIKKSNFQLLRQREKMRKCLFPEWRRGQKFPGKKSFDWFFFRWEILKSKIIFTLQKIGQFSVHSSTFRTFRTLTCGTVWFRMSLRISKRQLQQVWIYSFKT